MAPTRGVSRGRLIGAAAAAGLAATLPMRVAAAIGKLEKTSLNLGLASTGSNFLPVYVAATLKTWQDQGLDVSTVSFRGDSEVAQALAGNSIDVSLASMNGLINLIDAGQPVRGFFAGFDHADFAVLAQPAVKTWADLKQKTVGVSTFGSLTDALLRYDLRKHGLEPMRDVQVAQVGATQAAYQALKSGRIAAAILSPPGKWLAADEGFRVLGTQEHDIAPRWPKNLFMAKSEFLDKNPNTTMAFLRGFVAAIRAARRDPAGATKTLMDAMKLTEPYARRAYDAWQAACDERGNLPEKVMPTFWSVVIANGDVDRPWPEAKYFDRRYVDSFAQWAPS